MIDPNPANRARATRSDSLLRIALAATLAALACLPFAGPAAAQAKYVIREPIFQLLEMTRDSRYLCRNMGAASNYLVLFMPSSAHTVPVYWNPTADRFIQYPGTTGCVIWKRR